MAPYDMNRSDSSSTPSSSSTQIYDIRRRGNGGRAHSNKNIGSMPGLPMWAITITVTAVAITILFIGGSVYHAIRERRRVKTTGGSTRWEKIVWGGIKVAFSLWLIIGVFNLVNHGTWKGAKGSYREISEDQQQRSHGVSASGLTPTWTFDSSQNNLQVNTKYEPFSSIATSSQQSPRIRVTGSPQPPSRSRSPAVGLSRPSSPDQDAADGGDLASCRGHQRISFPGFTRLAGPYHAQRSDASY